MPYLADSGRMTPRTCGERCWSATRGGPGDPPFSGLLMER